MTFRPFDLLTPPKRYFLRPQIYFASLPIPKLSSRKTPALKGRVAVLLG